jgi:hypothetical protein
MTGFEVNPQLLAASADNDTDRQNRSVSHSTDLSQGKMLSRKAIITPDFRI